MENTINFSENTEIRAIIQGRRNDCQLQILNVNSMSKSKYQFYLFKTYLNFIHYFCIYITVNPLNFYL
jgi:hypothetical protein